jgi:branched-chain amino acid aminotransferase
MQAEASLMCPDVCCRSTIAIVMSPVGPYFPTGLKPISLFIDEHNVRAWPGGVGNNKVGTNYAPTIGPQSDAADTYGTSQVLYSFPQGSQPDDALVSECGAMNLMFFLQKVHALGFCPGLDSRPCL